MLDWFLSSMLVVVIAAFLRVAFWFVDESQGLVRRRNRVIEQVAEEETPRRPSLRTRVTAAPGLGSARTLCTGRYDSRRIDGGSDASMNRTTDLFVDDDEFIRGAYGDLLRDEGFSWSRPRTAARR